MGGFVGGGDVMAFEFLFGWFCRCFSGDFSSSFVGGVEYFY